MNPLKKIVGTVAPFLGSLLGSPFAAAGIKLLSNVLLGKDNASEDEIAKAISLATPEQLIELKKIDADYKIKMEQLGIDEQKIATLDRDSARQREIQVQDKVPAILAMMVTVGFFGVLLTMTFYPIQPDAKGVIDVMLGALGTAWICCVNYYFGSSCGSKQKTEIISKK